MNPAGDAFPLQDLKRDFVELFGLSKDAMHIHIGLALFLAAMVLFRCRISDIRPWLIVLVFTVGNEVTDMLEVLNRKDPLSAGKHLRDFWNTMFWPTLVLLYGRWRERSGQGRDAPHGGGDGADG